jgi:hypothetical protein
MGLSMVQAQRDRTIPPHSSPLLQSGQWSVESSDPHCVAISIPILAGQMMTRWPTHFDPVKFSPV